MNPAAQIREFAGQIAALALDSQDLFQYTSGDFFKTAREAQLPL